MNHSSLFGVFSQLATAVIVVEQTAVITATATVVV